MKARAREVGALLAVAACAACSTRSTSPSPPIDAASDGPAFDVGVLGRAEDRRRAKDVPAEAQRDHDPQVRRRAARALARILDADDAPLLRALNDEDDEVVAWAGYGLGESCKEHEESHVRALAARLAELDPARPAAAPVDARVAVLRALGRCAGDVAEQTLRAWLRRADARRRTAEAAAYALGEASSRRGSVSLESIGALLEAAQRTPPVEAALYAFGRVDTGGDDAVLSRLARGGSRGARPSRAGALLRGAGPRAGGRGRRGRSSPASCRRATSRRPSAPRPRDRSRACARPGRRRSPTRSARSCPTTRRPCRAISTACC